MVRFHIHGSDGLAVLDICRVAGRTPHNHDIQRFFHVLFQLFINHFLMDCREIAQMNALRRLLVMALYQI